ncbi:MAG: mechanosensitive ion channel family protein [Candidatus Baltobacteraceae bacterium]
MFDGLTHDAAFMERLGGAVVVLLLTVLVARLAARWVGSIGRRTEHRLFSMSLYSTLVQVAILIVGVLTVLSTLGIAIAPVLTTLGLGGLAVALALNDTLTNLFAGIQIITAHQLRIGDYVHFDFAEGEVTDIQWHNTTVRDLQNNLVVIPNAKVNTSVFTNFSRGDKLVIPVTASIAWKGSYSRLHEIASAAANGARVRMTAINETNIQVTAYLPAHGYSQRNELTGDFLERLHDAALSANMGVVAKP